MRRMRRSRSRSRWRRRGRRGRRRRWPRGNTLTVVYLGVRYPVVACCAYALAYAQA
jgi:hypothetical protein